MTNIPFEQVSYLAQVRRLRSLAETAIRLFPVQAKNIHFINHGENATFQVEAKNGKKYLLRIHRNDYHTRPAIEEELKWLKHLSKDDSLSVPTPVQSKSGRWVEWAATSEIPKGRNCCLFQWIEGRFLRKSLNNSHMNVLGQLIGKLHARVPKVSHRNYWNAEGLVGKEKPKFGSVENLIGVKAKHQKLISEARRQVFHKLRNFERKFPQRQSLIHADLHFGNILALKDGLGAIDFDDCGLGFQAYDLVIPFISIENVLTGQKRQKEFPKFKDALLNGYSKLARWDAHDEAILPHLISARKILMVGWLNSRSDNPRLKKHLEGAVERVADHVKLHYSL